MKAAVYKGIGQIEIEEVEKPRINSSEALVKIEMAGICGTDVKLLLGSSNVSATLYIRTQNLLEE